MTLTQRIYTCLICSHCSGVLWAWVLGILAFSTSIETLEAQTIAVDSRQSTSSPKAIGRVSDTTATNSQRARSRLRSAPPRQALSAEEIDTFGFDDVDPRTKKALEKYRKTQRRYGFERAGRGVDVEAGYEAAGKNSIRR